MKINTDNAQKKKGSKIRTVAANGRFGYRLDKKCYGGWCWFQVWTGF